MDVRFRGVRFSRGSRLVLEVPDLAVPSGQTTALVGPNGSGKTTLLRLIADLEQPATGEVLLGEMAAKGRPAHEQVAFAFQRPVFVSGTVRDNLDLALRLRRLPATLRERRISEVAAACGIGELLDRSAARLSGGEAQRANLARALSVRAPVTLLDEPLSGLDGPSRRHLLHDLPGLLRDFAITTIVVTHDRDEALRLAEQMVVLIGGRVRAAGRRAEVFGNPPDAETAAFLGFTVIPREGGVVAIAPRGLHPGRGDFTFTMEVDDILDFGVRREAWGRVGGVTVSVRLPRGEEPGPTMLVSASAEMVRAYGASDGASSS
jgi:ABC-type sugar transport system ATPase subunit